MKLLSCTAILALCSVGYAQNVPQAATPPNKSQPKVAVAPVAPQKVSPPSTARVSNGPYWYQAANGQWCWQPGSRTAVAPTTTATVPQAPAATGQPYTTYRYSYDPSRGQMGASQLQPGDQVRALQREVSRLQQAVDELQAPQNLNRSFNFEDWWSRQQRGETNGDPSLFQ